MEKFIYDNGATLEKVEEEEFIYTSPKGKEFVIFHMLDFVGIFDHKEDDDETMGSLVWWFCDWYFFMDEWDSGKPVTLGPIYSIDEACTAYENNGYERVDWMTV